MYQVAVIYQEGESYETRQRPGDAWSPEARQAYWQIINKREQIGNRACLVALYQDNNPLPVSTHRVPGSAS